jgi:LDH2 family malate/lactate/ureidoglycolate dehydrogenase
LPGARATAALHKARDAGITLDAGLLRELTDLAG